MYNENINNRILNKLESAMNIYAKSVYQKVGELEAAEAFFTKEHLRAVDKR